jgi:hypothetical protein
LRILRDSGLRDFVRDDALAGFNNAGATVEERPFQGRVKRIEYDVGL